MRVLLVWAGACTRRYKSKYKRDRLADEGSARGKYSEELLQQNQELHSEHLSTAVIAVQLHSDAESLDWSDRSRAHRLHLHSAPRLGAGGRGGMPWCLLGAVEYEQEKRFGVALFV